MCFSVGRGGPLFQEWYETVFGAAAKSIPGGIRTAGPTHFGIGARWVLDSEAWPCLIWDNKED